MKRSIFIFLYVVFFSCTSFPEKVKKNKDQFILVAKENSKSIEINNLESLLRNAEGINIEAKMKVLVVDSIHTIYGLDAKNGFDLDSIVLFKSSNYRVIYDFASNQRETEFVKAKTGLKEFEVIESKLYVGKY